MKTLHKYYSSTSNGDCSSFDKRSSILNSGNVSLIGMSFFFLLSR